MAIPTVTACLPTFNSEDFIEATLLSVVGQTYRDLTILISNDASTDRTGQICESFAEADPRITVIHQSTNLGWTGNCAALVERVDTDYFFFAFHDDLLHVDYVAHLVAKMEENPAAVVAFCDSQVIRRDGSRDRASFGKGFQSGDRLARVLSVARRDKSWALIIHGLFRSSVVKPMGGPKRNLAGEVAADWPWILGLATRGEFVRVPEALFTKTKRPDSESRRWKRDRIRFAAVVLSCARSTLQSSLFVSEKIRVSVALVQVWWRGIESFAWRKESSKHRREAIRRIRQQVPDNEQLILIDEGNWRLNDKVGCTVLPFLEKDGVYWGLPESEEVAVAELHRMQRSGAGYVAVCWPALWWLESYGSLNRVLRSDHDCVYESNSVVIFRLR